MISKKRKQINNETKLEIIQNKDNLKPGELASKFGLPPSTISTIIGNKEKILEYFQQNKIDERRKRIRVSNYKSIEEALILWFINGGFYKCKEKNDNEIDKENSTHNDENEMNNDVNEEEDDVIKEKRELDKLKDNINFDVYKYISIDDKLSCYGTMTDEEIVQTIKDGDIVNSDDSSTTSNSNDSCDINKIKISPAIALSHLDSLIYFLQQEQLDMSLYLDYLHKIHNHIDKARRFNQSKIDKYFQ
jgi:hypothetical protein